MRTSKLVSMVAPRLFPLESIRTDGWFERIGEGIGSFQALCEIVGERFFAFSMITGARITALTVDRRNQDNTLVDFVVGGAEAETAQVDTQRLTLADFRRRLVSALLAAEPTGPAPERSTDLEALQLHIGVRYLLLSPLFGYSLQELYLRDDGAEITLLHDGIEETYDLELFRNRLRSHVREELDRVTRGQNRGAIDLARVAEAEAAAADDDHVRVLELLGAWPAPLAIFLRTPEGQLLEADSRATIARGLGMLGSACIALGEMAKGEEVLRLGVQYAGDGPAGHDIFRRLGVALLDNDRPGEAIGALRRAVSLGAETPDVWVALAGSYAARNRMTAAVAAGFTALDLGAPPDSVAPSFAKAKQRLGSTLTDWATHAGIKLPGS